MSVKNMTKDNDLLGGSKGSKSYVPRCYESHPPYEVAPGIVIYGGACGYPMIKDADVYGGFDWGMKKQAGGYPWAPVENAPVEFLFKITDMQAPSDPKEFERMIVWLAEQLQAGKKVHIGCIGGHGRTGTVLAALHKHMTGDVNATQHVREHYCKKAVESKAQIAFLEKEWGIVPVAPTKTYSYGSNSSGGKKTGSNLVQFKLPGSYEGTSSTNQASFDLSSKDKYRSYEEFPQVQSTGMPLKSEHSIWGKWV